MRRRVEQSALVEEGVQEWQRRRNNRNCMQRTAAFIEKPRRNNRNCQRTAAFIEKRKNSSLHSERRMYFSDALEAKDLGRVGHCQKKPKRRGSDAIENLIGEMIIPHEVISAATIGRLLVFDWECFEG